MKVIRTLAEMQEISTIEKKQGSGIGFVPTMGYLHEGHLSLMRQARQETDLLVSSIFVNPLQFGPGEDFDSYPRDEDRDRELAEQAGVDVLFLPEAKEMYPETPVIRLEAAGRTDVLCGRTRPGHFDGVVTVLAKLFHLVQPDKAYFGWKDAQQLAVVQGLVWDLNFPVEIVAVETIREPDGLARSSRNVYLSPRERQEAKYLYQALRMGRYLVIDGEKNPDRIIKEVKHFIHQHTSGKMDYVELLSFPALKTVEKAEGQVILAAAVQFQAARLIDNQVFDAGVFQ